MKRQKFLIRKTQEFWGRIWGERKEHWKDAQWLENFKRDFECKEEQEEVKITYYVIDIKENAKLERARS